MDTLNNIFYFGDDIASVEGFIPDQEDIEDNDELFWEHKYTIETDDDGFPPYDEELCHIEDKSSDSNIDFFNAKL